MQTITVVSTASFKQAKAYTSALATHLAERGCVVMISPDGRSMQVFKPDAAKQRGLSQRPTSVQSLSQSI